MAIDAAKTKRYDLIFMDHMMPIMDGIEATRLIRLMGEDEDPHYSDVPIIALTANAVSGTRDMFLNNGFNDFISKPIDMVRLNSVLEKWIPKKRQKKISEKNIEFIDNKNSDTKNIKIEGVNTEKGIFMSNGNIEAYAENLSIFYNDGLEKIQEIKSCLEAGDIGLYTIYVHALKSAAANIGANDLSEAAKALEMAGGQKYINFIEADNPQFLADLELLLNRIHNALSEYKGIGKGGGESAEIADIDMKEFKSEIAELKSALETFNFSVINKTVESIKKYAQSGSIGEAVRKISDKILIGEYDEAAAVIENLLADGD
jgi:CheY-like chemotaxis protein